MKVFLVFIAFSLFISSCAIHKGSITPSSMYNKKMQFVDIAVGYSKSSYFLGMGGINKDALVNEAKRNMYLSYKLKPGQSFENSTLDIKTTFVGPFKKQEVILISDVAEGDTATTNISYSNKYLQILSGEKPPFKNDFSLNETALYWDNNIRQAKTCKIIKIDTYKASIFFMNSNASLQVKNILTNNLFKTSNAETIEAKVKFKLNQKVNYANINNAGQQEIINGTIVGLNRYFALIKVSYSYEKIKYFKLKAL